MDISEEAFLSHYGIKGMKWGIRKKSSESNAGRKKFKRNLAASATLGIIGGVAVSAVMHKNAARSPEIRSGIQKVVETSMVARDGSGKVVSQSARYMSPETVRMLYGR